MWKVMTFGSALVMCTACGAGLDALPGAALFGLGAGESVPTEGTAADGTPRESTTPAADDAACAPAAVEACAAECRFDRYNIDVQVGDTFVFSNFVACNDPLGAHSFALESGDWAQLDGINSGVAITITAQDAEGGNHGVGEYRVELLDSAGSAVDHATLRIGHGDESDVGPEHLTARVPLDCAAVAACAPAASSDDDCEDDSAGSDDDGSDDDGEGGGADDGTVDEGGANPDDGAEDTTGGADDGTADEGGTNPDDGTADQGGTASDPPFTPPG